MLHKSTVLPQQAWRTRSAASHNSKILSLPSIWVRARASSRLRRSPAITRRAIWLTHSCTDSWDSLGESANAWWQDVNNGAWTTLDPLIAFRDFSILSEFTPVSDCSTISDYPTITCECLVTGSLPALSWTRLLCPVPTNCRFLRVLNDSNATLTESVFSLCDLGNTVSENVAPHHLLNIKTVSERRENILWFHVPPKIYFKYGCLPVSR